MMDIFCVLSNGHYFLCCFLSVVLVVAAIVVEVLDDEIKNVVHDSSLVIYIIVSYILQFAMIILKIVEKKTTIVYIESRREICTT